MLDPKALEAAVRAATLVFERADPTKPNTYRLIDEATAAAIEAYVVALWHLISEAPRDGTRLWLYGLMNGSPWW